MPESKRIQTEHSPSAHSPSKPPVLLPSAHPEKKRRWKIRLFKDNWARYIITLGGNSVIVAILLIFFYLLYETAPLLKGADMKMLAQYSLLQPLQNAADTPRSAFFTLEELGEVAAEFDVNGQVKFFHSKTGGIIKKTTIPVPLDAAVSSFAAADPASNTLAYGLTNGRIIVLRHEYRVSYPDDQRRISPDIVYPLGEQPLVIDPAEQPLLQLALASSEDRTTIAALTADKKLHLVSFVTAAKPFSFDYEPVAEVTAAKRLDIEIPLSEEVAGAQIRYLLINKEQTQLLLIYQDNSGRSLLAVFSINTDQAPRQIQQLVLAEAANPVTAAAWLTGGTSLLLGQQNGRITQWFAVPGKDSLSQIQLIREFHEQQAAIVQIVSEMQRKGFAALDQQGVLGIYHSTAEKNLLVKKIAPAAAASAVPAQFTLAPRANYLLTVNRHNQAAFWSIDNQHPEISWHSMWGKVWYENYPRPEYIWQSSSASNDFEPKFSLTPLAFGTLKAAFYAMLFAIPLAIMGAIYTAYFMSPRVRGVVKPSIEIMEALPTVILGFLAGLWLAPLIEGNLPAVFSLLLVLPVSVLLVAWCWHLLPAELRRQVPEGWEAFILMPVLLLVTWGTFALSLPMEEIFFNGDMQSWLDNELGIDFDQRNSIVIGIAMGFAVIPTIFSITEDAIFSVPRHLTLGSLALGATRWQTLIRVVILTASPAIFSAVMIGFGRAIGETMIVLMATGNTPIMDFSIFQGMRTLSANIAVEIPESEVGSSHYRVLFLAALVLFAFTFMFNTIAELIRQRLREKYSNL